MRRLFKQFLSYGMHREAGKAFAAVLLCTLPARAEEVTLLALGDSLTQGYGLIEVQGFVPRLDDWLEAQGVAVRVINAGVSGDTTAGGAARVTWSLTDEVDAMIVALGGNDLLRGIDPAVSRANLAAILDAAQDREVEVLLVGMRAPGNYGADYKAAFDAIYPELAAAYGVALYPDFFVGLGNGTPDELQRFFQSDGLHPNAEGVTRIVAAMGPAVLALIAPAP